ARRRVYAGRSQAARSRAAGGGRLHPPFPRQPAQGDVRAGVSRDCLHRWERSAPVTNRPRIAVTLGDPRGIGAEVVARALRDERVARAATYVLVGPTGTDVDVQESVGAWHAGGDASTAG